MKTNLLIPSALFSFVLLNACVTHDPYSGDKKTSSSTKGAVAGAVTGAVLGNQVKGDKKTRQNARIAGAVLGGLIGGGIGNYMDKQEAQLRQDLANTGVGVTREGDRIILNMPGNVTFNVGKSTIQSNFYSVLDSVSKVLANYKETNVLIEGHTDSTGSNQDNQLLSEQRAKSVSAYLARNGVAGSRLSTVGYGESQPIADNSTAAGRERNRRVEITLTPKG